jgi:Ran GTPase-activating protein (RanGAP) involved in mRNA processing and transport
LDAPLLFSQQSETTVHLAKMLAVNTSLTHLSLAKHGIGDHGANYLAEYVTQNAALTSLHLRCNRIGATGAGHLGRALAHEYCCLEELNLR